MRKLLKKKGIYPAQFAKIYILDKKLKCRYQVSI